MQAMKQILMRYAPNGQANPNQFWQMIAEFYNVRTRQIILYNQIPGIIQRNRIQMSSKYGMSDFAHMQLIF